MRQTNETMKKLIRYRMPISLTYPKGHKRAGERTYFVDKILKNGISFYKFLEWQKIHTIRINYPLWEKRFKEIMAGEAVLELYYWSGKLYRSKPVVICQLGKDDGIGLQKLENGCISLFSIDHMEIKDEILAKNDGLSLEDFNEWFKNYDLSKPLALIHFTEFRY